MIVNSKISVINEEYKRKYVEMLEKRGEREGKIRLFISLSPGPPPHGFFLQFPLHHPVKRDGE
jgi:hypothetical protein